MAVKVIKKGEEGSHPIISNLVCMPPDNRSILKKIAELPKDQQKALLEEIIEKKYPEYGYEGIKYDWELNARPSQLIPFDIDKDWSTFCYNAGRGFGKGATLDTPIPTPSGWATMGELSVGDKVFDEHGNICNVVAVTDVYMPDKAYRLYFSDGTSIDVCDQHQFVTWTHRDRKAYLRKGEGCINYNNTNKFPEDWVNWQKEKHPNLKKNEFDNYIKIKALLDDGLKPYQIMKNLNLTSATMIYKMMRDKDYWKNRSTIKTNETIGPSIKIAQEIVDTFYYGKRNDLNHCIPLAGSLKLNEIELPLDPYLYGQYLGDGSKHDASLATHKEDYVFYKNYLENKGFVVKPLKLVVKDGKELNSGVFKVENLYKTLKSMDCVGTKKVLSIYTRASEYQRLELIKGLLDTDGTISSTNGQIEFCNTDKEIFDLAYELLISLGQKPTTSTKIGTLYGVPKKLVYRLRFLPTRFDLFALTRKLDILKTYSNNLSQQLRNHHRMLTRFEEIEPVPMKCIQVDSPNSMYLIGKQMLPTHNSRVASEWVIRLAEKFPECRIGLVGATAGDVLNTLVQGESGIINSAPPWFKPKWNPSYQKLTFPNKSECEYFSGEKADRLRGRNFNFAIADEFTSWRFPEQTWDMLSMTLRIGTVNKRLITTTPKNIAKYVEILKKESTWTYVGRTFENQDNLTSDFTKDMVSVYSGTRLGQQELEAEILADDENALWKRDWIEKNRVLVDIDIYGEPVPRNEILPDFLHVVLAIDPAVSVNKSSAETAITVAAYGEDGKYYVLYADSFKDTPEAWANRVYDLYDRHMCDSIIVETNQGGNLVISNLKMSGRQAPIVEVRARRGKLLRAEPIAGLYERNLVRHFGILTKAESQMCNFNQHQNKKELCDTVDSTVYALQALLDRTERYYTNGAFYAVGGPRETVMTFKVM